MSPIEGSAITELAEQMHELRERGGLPSPREAPAIWREVLLDDAHHSTALEGNALDREQVRQVLDETFD